MRAQHVIRAARDPKPEPAARRCPCGCDAAVTAPNIYATKRCVQRGREWKTSPTSKRGLNPHNLFAGRPPKSAPTPASAVNSWWTRPMSREAFMRRACGSHPPSSFVPTSLEELA